MQMRVKKYLAWTPADAEKAATLSALLGDNGKLAAEATHQLIPRHDPPLTDREEAIYLLHIASEVEHALMIQYLYAAFSLGGPQVPESDRDRVRKWREIILGIAREEMGHLATVQNILQLLGGPVVFDREDFPIPSDLYPFTFTLEPLTLSSLRSYVLAEMPDLKTLSEEDRKYVEAIQASGTQHVNRVGLVYEQIIELLGRIPAAEFYESSKAYQARGDEWGLGYTGLLILMAKNQDEAKKAMTAIAEQGEAAGVPRTKLMEPSHFERFLAIYREFPKPGDWQPSLPLPLNPVVPTENAPATEDQTAITLLNTRRWAQLGNLRYRLLLVTLTHAFLTASAPDADQKPSPRGLLTSWAFGEMYHLRSLGDILALKPLAADDDRPAGLPFEMPYTLALPERPLDRWRLQRDILLSAGKLADEMLKTPNDHEPYLRGMKSTDQEALGVINGILNS